LKTKYLVVDSTGTVSWSAKFSVLRERLKVHFLGTCGDLPTIRILWTRLTRSQNEPLHVRVGIGGLVMEYSSTALIDKYCAPADSSTACSGCGLGMKQDRDPGIEELGSMWVTLFGGIHRMRGATLPLEGRRFRRNHGRVYAIARGLRIACSGEEDNSYGR